MQDELQHWTAKKSKHPLLTDLLVKCDWARTVKVWLFLALTSPGLSGGGGLQRRTSSTAHAA